MTQVMTTEGPKTTVKRSVSQIAKEITQDWSKLGKGINYAAKPYLNAMREMENVTDNYHLDSGSSVIRYFLANASTYRGETAKRLKAELNKMLKDAKV